MSLAKKLITPIPIEKVWDLDYIKFMLQASASSTKFGVVDLHQINNSIFSIRGNINCMLISPFGAGKTTQIFDMEGVEIERGNNLSMPGLVGTISREGQLIKGSCMRAGGKLLIIDEAQSIPRSVMDAMNALLEPPHQYTRALGFKMMMPVKEPKSQRGNFWIRGEENQFTMKSKFSCIASSMRVKLRSTIEYAFFSRFIPARMRLDRDYVKKMLSGGSVHSIKVTNFKGDFIFKDYLQFKDYYFDRFDKSHWARVFDANDEKYGHVIRNVGDLCRLAAFMAARRGTNYVSFEDAKKIADKFFDQIFYNIMMGPLKHNEYNVLNLIGKTQEEIAEELNTTQQNISRIMLGLRRKGLLIPKSKSRQRLETPLKFSDWVQVRTSED